MREATRRGFSVAAFVEGFELEAIGSDEGIVMFRFAPKEGNTE